eukprot:Skav201401  [mRNA]  locus=scaffold296:382265:387148:+ [translate_table: standard]
MPESRAYTLLGATVLTAKERIHLRVQETEVLPHVQPTSRLFRLATETCGGMGFLGQGLVQANMEIMAHNELREPYCKWKQSTGSCPVVQGDIGDVQTIKSLFWAKGGSTMLTAGFSCQPWSRLGDCRGEDDERSSCLTKVLKASHLLQSHSLLLECVCAAGKDAWVQSILGSFCKQTGYNKQEMEMALQTLLPAQRSRWWCLLRAPVLPTSPLAPFPVLPQVPVIADLLPGVMNWPQQDIEQLALNAYETRKFHSFGGIGPNLIQSSKPLKTALHGWGNQLDKCPCTCRDFPMSDARLESKGIFAALYKIGDHFSIGQELVPCTRHIHPWELAVAHGIFPDQSWEPLRLTLSGMGQMAGPVQACWMASFFMEDASFFLGVRPPTPEENVWNLFSDLFRGMAASIPESVLPGTVGQYFERVTCLLDASRVARYPSIQHLPLPKITPADPATHPIDTHAVHDLVIPETRLDATAPRETQHGCDVAANALCNTPAKRRRIEDCPHVHGGLPAFAVQVPSPGVSFTQAVKEHFDAEAVAESVGDEPTCASGVHEPVASTAPPAVEHDTSGHESMDIPTASGRESDQCSKTPFMKALHDAARNSSPQVILDAKGGSTCVPSTEQPVHIPAPMDIPLPSLSSSPVSADHTDGRMGVASPIEDKQVLDHESRLPPDGSSPQVTMDAKGGRPWGSDSDREQGVSASTPPVTADSKGGKTEEAPSPDPAHDYHTVILIKPESNMPHAIRIHKDATVGSITVAEEKLMTMVNPVRTVDLIGRPLILGDTTHDHQLVQLDSFDEEPLLDGVPERLHSPELIPRDHLLYLQKQWVANDEFDFYLTILQNTGHTNMVPTHSVPPGIEDSELKKGLHDWMLKCMYGAVSNRQAASAMVVQGHWMPVLVTQNAMGIRIRTTPEGKNWMSASIPSDNSIHVQEHPLPVGFPADCGFQSIAWLTRHVLDAHQEAHSTTVPLGPHNAIAWRSLFLSHLRQKPIEQVVPVDIAFGGMGQGDVTDTLRQLLLDHGVPEAEVTKRADAVLSTLGRASIVTALRGPRPWQDLKSLANQASPKFQLVLAHELSAVIQSRAPNKRFGEKKQKVKQLPATRVCLTPNDVMVPDGVLFKDSDGHLVTQIKVSDIRPDATGIALVTMQEALPYIKKNITVSTRALALVIIDPHEVTTQMVGQSLRIPAKCVHTQEPVLLTGRIVQIGTGAIMRHMPQQTLKVDEVPNSVLRAVAFRDELPIEWELLLNKPVKEIMKILPELAAADRSEVLDCWDRQFLTLKMQRCRPSEAEQFIVTFRIQTSDICALLASSGKQGIYLEPRDEDGRRPSNNFRVVWLGKMSKPEAMIAMNSTTKWVCLVRTSSRYGLRVKHLDAPHVHAQHKETPYLDTLDARLFIGGPFPWGATRTTLNKLFSQWQWPARPLQPKGRSIDGKGLMWEIQASKDPQYEIYTLEHADILIAAVPPKSKQATKSMQEIQGSERTLAALKQQSSSRSSVDPLQEDDPWAPKQARVTGPPGLPGPARVDVAMAQVEQRVAQQIQHQVRAQVEAKVQEFDRDMGDDDRITDLEAKVQQIEQVIQQNHQSQHRHNQEVATQIHQINQKVDAQTTSLQQHLDSKLNEQLQHIELLLTKARE